MSDKQLRSELIRLARENPDLAVHVLPILKEGQGAASDEDKALLTLMSITGNLFGAVLERGVDSNNPQIAKLAAGLNGKVDAFRRTVRSSLPPAQRRDQVAWKVLDHLDRLG